METKKTDLEKPDVVKDLVALHTRGLKEFEQDWKDAEENKRFMQGEHWSEEEKAGIEAEDRIAYCMPLVESKANALVSQKLTDRTDFKCIPRTKEDEIGAEVDNMLLKFIDEDNDLEHTEADTYVSGLLIKYGAVEREIDQSEEIRGTIKIEKLMYNRVLWDRNCRKFNISKYANWIQKISFYTKEQLQDMYPDHADRIKEIQGDQWDKTKDNITEWYREDKGLQLMKVITHYQRKYKKVFRQAMSDGNVTESDTTVGDLEKLNAKRTAEHEKLYGKENKLLGIIKKLTTGKEVPELVLFDEEFPRVKEYIEKTVFHKDITDPLENSTEDTKIIRIHILFSDFIDGSIKCLMDKVKHPQKFLDRLTSQADKSMGKMIKNSYELVEKDISEEDMNNWDVIKKELTGGGAVVRVKRPNAINLISGADTNFLSMILQTWNVMVRVLEDVMGGATLQGVDRGDKSGVALEQLKEEGYMMAFVYVFNFRRWKKGLGEGLLEDIKKVYGEHPDRIVRVMGESATEEIMNILTNKGLLSKGEMPGGPQWLDLSKLEKSLGETKVDIIMSREEKTPDARMKKWRGILTYIQLLAGIPNEEIPPMSMFFEYLQLDATVKSKLEKWESEKAKRQERQLALQEKEMKFKADMEMLDKTIKGGEANARINQMNNPESQEQPSGMFEGGRE